MTQQFHEGQEVEVTRAAPINCPRERMARAMDELHAALEARAAQTVRAIIKDRARAYAMDPRHLDAIRPGLFALPPRRLVEALDAIGRPPDWRYFGFGGEHPALNFQAATLYARFARAKAAQLARRAA